MILDNRLMGDPATGLHYSVFLYETVMFCCVGKDLSGNGGTHTLCPIKPKDYIALTQYTQWTAQLEMFTGRQALEIGRKGPRSDTSSVLQKGDQISILNPTLLPMLFTNNSAIPKSPTRSGLSVDIPPLTPLLATFSSETDEEGQYPIAHGGYSDIWKGVLQQDDSRELKVVVKVLRNTTSDPVLKVKVVDRLNRELNIWKKLSSTHH
ncbi:hypothetical protein K443DRAFT_642502 [Laccaria amethystina LaAM-08-1]|uniref:Uncharacterized protein n=1 Tax=Laccaria amethystina LaAM-08-1 TaxID=1095629 RepID=A0A0C9WRS1_9AGAR|nr:hypothetical protein K443DRAFT_642502 [Laccaria amethystina LaAM-08-1]